MNVTVIGTGYVGLVSGLCLANVGHHVIFVDVDVKKIDLLNFGKAPFFEPGLETLLDRVKARCTFSTDLPTALKNAEIVIIAVGTPTSADGSADLRSLWQLCDTLAAHIPDQAVLVLRSTVPVGTTDELARRTDHKLVAFNPEFLRQGSAIADFQKPDRIIIGTNNAYARERLSDLYEAFRPETVLMPTKSAEMTKYASNAMLAARISIMNELAELCETTGADIEEVRKGMGLDPRIGPAFLEAGTGYGGSCFPKDVKALVAMGTENGQNLGILRAVNERNERQKTVLLRKALKHFGKLQGVQVAIWGLSFKTDTDDLRESPSVDLIKGLLAEGAVVTVFDPIPKAMGNAKAIFGDSIQYADGLYRLLEPAQALFLMHKGFPYTPRELAHYCKLQAVFDGRNNFDPREMYKFSYYPVGRRS